MSLLSISQQMLKTKLVALYKKKREEDEKKAKQPKTIKLEGISLKSQVVQNVEKQLSDILNTYKASKLTKLPALKQKLYAQLGQQLEETAMPIKAAARGMMGGMYLKPPAIQAETPQEKEKYQTVETLASLVPWMTAYGRVAKGLGAIAGLAATKLPTLGGIGAKVAPTLIGKAVKTAVPWAVTEAIMPQEDRVEAIETALTWGGVFGMAGGVLGKVGGAFLKGKKGIISQKLIQEKTRLQELFQKAQNAGNYGEQGRLSDKINIIENQISQIVKTNPLAKTKWWEKEPIKNVPSTEFVLPVQSSEDVVKIWKGKPRQKITDYLMPITRQEAGNLKGLLIESNGQITEAVSLKNIKGAKQTELEGWFLRVGRIKSPDEVFIYRKPTFQQLKQYEEQNRIYKKTLSDYSARVKGTIPKEVKEMQLEGEIYPTARKDLFLREKPPEKGIIPQKLQAKKTEKEVLNASGKVYEKEIEIQNAKEALLVNPAKELEKYANRKTGELPEVLGEGKGFKKKGDQLVTELGFKDSEQAREAYQKYRIEKENLVGLIDQKSFLRSIEKNAVQKEVRLKNDIKEKIYKEQYNKELSSNVLSRIKEKHGIKEWSSANKEQLQKVLDDFKNLQKGDEMIPRSQVESLKKFGVKLTTTKREAVEILGDVAKWKERNWRIANFFKTIDQKIETVAGKDAEKVKDILTRPRAKAVTEMIREELTLKTAMRDMLNNLRVNTGKDRALIMRFGEKRMTVEELKKATPKWQQIIEADKWFRDQYNTLLETTNVELKRLGYAENKLIPKRQDYYTHSQELGKIWDLARNKGGDISPVLEQISEFTRPNRKFNPFALKRLGGKEFVEDAGKAFEAYLTPTLNNKYLTESIIRHRAVADILAHATLKTKDLNQFIGSLRYASDNLAGKTNPFDRPIMNFVVGRNAMQALNQMTQRFAANRIVGNTGSSLMQISGIPNSVLKNNIIRTSKGLLTQAFSPLLGKNDPLLKSEAMIRRYGIKGLEHGETVFPGLVQRGAKIASIPFRVIEKYVSKGIWRASFGNAWSQGYRGKELMTKADEIAMSCVGARTRGEKAMAFESGLLSLPLQFQLEVNTSAQMWSEQVFSKIFKNPLQATRAATEASITLFLMNTLFEKTLGRSPLPDPIRAISEAIDADSYSEGIGRILGEGLSNVAGGQFIAGLFPTNLKKKYFGRSEVGIYPGGIPLATALKGGFRSPTQYVYDFILPFGGGQLKKILQGIEGLDKMGSYSKSGKLQFPINQNQWLQVITFGKYSTKEAKEYFDKQRTTLSDKQTVEYFLRTQKGENPQEVYKDVIKDRIRKEYEREIVKEVIGKIKDKPDEGLALLQLWKTQNIISNEMEKEIIDGLKK